METSFFDYTCDRCGQPVCERVQIMNLALDYTEALFCLACLAEEQGMGEGNLAVFVRDYIESRECFKTPWDAFDPSPCPRQATRQCFCQNTLILDATGHPTPQEAVKPTTDPYPNKAGD